MKAIIDIILQNYKYENEGGNMKRIFLGFFVSIILCSGLIVPLSTYATTPVISTVAGTFTGKLLSITGANMVNENTANWSSFFSSHPNASGFEGSSYTGDGYTDSHPSGCNPTTCYPPVYDPSVKLMGNKSVKYHVQGPGSLLVSYMLLGSHGISPWPGDMWVRFYARWDTNFLNSSHLKMIDTYGGSQQYYGPFPKLTGLGIKDNTGVCASTPPPNSGSTVLYDYPLDINRWYLMEIQFKSTPPYIFDAYIDGQRIIQSTPCASVAFSGLMLGIINTRIDDPTGWMDHWWDGFTISTTRVYAASTIEISNNPIYGQGTVKYQEPIYLSDGSVQIKADFTGLGSGPLYLWVTNNSQERSAPYYIGSGLGNIIAPSPPTGLH